MHILHLKFDAKLDPCTHFVSVPQGFMYTLKLLQLEIIVFWEHKSTFPNVEEEIKN